MQIVQTNSGWSYSSISASDIVSLCVKLSDYSHIKAITPNDYHKVLHTVSRVNHWTMYWVKSTMQWERQGRGHGCWLKGYFRCVEIEGVGVRRLCHGAGFELIKGRRSGSEGEPGASLLPSRQTLTLSTPVPRQSPAGTQKPSLVGLSLGLMRTSLGGAKRYAWMPFTSTSFT